MAKKQQTSIIPNGAEHYSNRLADYVSAIIRELSQLQSAGVNPSEIFDDWLECCYHTLLMMPKHAESIAATGKMADDTPEVQKHFSRINGRYCSRHPENWAHIHRSFSYLLDSVHESMDQSDALGEVYMQFAYPNLSNGQFFTPWSVCQIMAELTIKRDGEGRVAILRHIKQTIEEAGKDNAVVLFIESALMTSMLLPADDENAALDFFLKNVVAPATSLPNWKPIAVHDPAVGSGRCLIAASRCFPEWANHLGVVQYSGQDIDHTCVMMAQINMILHGLNLHWLRTFKPIAHLVPSVREALAANENGLESMGLIKTEEVIEEGTTAVDSGQESAALAANEWRKQVAAELPQDNSENFYQLSMFGDMPKKKRGNK